MHAVVQGAQTNKVMMHAYMDEESSKLALETNIAHYWSRSRKKLWKNGESSGRLRKVQKILIDCDCDEMLLKVEQIGGTCYTGSYIPQVHPKILNLLTHFTYLTSNII